MLFILQKYLRTYMGQICEHTMSTDIARRRYCIFYEYNKKESRRKFIQSFEQSRTHKHYTIYICCVAIETYVNAKQNNIQKSMF